jgi:hypothetical protein
MASSYTEGLVIELIGSGDKAGSWGDVTNSNLQALNQGVSGFSDIDLSSQSSPYSIDLLDAQAASESTSPSRSSVIRFYGHSDGFVVNFQINGTASTRINCIIVNGHASSSLVVGTGAGGTVTIPATYSARVHGDGSGLENSFANLSVTKLALGNQEVISNTVDDRVDIVSSTLQIGDGSGAAVIQSDGTGTGDRDLILRNSTTNTGSIRIHDANNGDIDITTDGTGEVNISKVDIADGEIDGTVIGGNSAAAGTFTTLGATGTSTLAAINASGNIATSGSTTITAANGLIATAGGLTVTAGGITVNGGGLDLAGGGITNAGNIGAGTVTASLTGDVTGDVIGDVSGSALTVTQGSQPAITSVGTLTNLNVDNVNVNGNTIGSTSGNLIITPSSGSDVVIDTHTTIDGGVVTSTSFIGALTGNVTGDVSGNAGSVTNGVYTTNKINVLAATSSAELAGVISDETGTGSLVFANSPTFVTPALGTPSALVGTNISGTAANLTAGTATTIPSLSGDVTSSGNSVTIANNVIDEANLQINGSPTNDYVLVADDTEPGGMKWASNTTGDITGVTGGTNITVTSGTGPVPDVNLDSDISLTSVTTTGIIRAGGATFAGGSAYISAEGGFRSSTYTSRTSNQAISISPNGTGAVSISSDFDSILASGGIGLTTSNSRINFQTTSSDYSKGLITFRTKDYGTDGTDGTDAFQFVVNQTGAYLHDGGGQYLNFTSGYGATGNGIRGDGNNAIEIKSKIGTGGSGTVDNWGRAYHSGMVTGDGAYFEGTCVVTANTEQTLDTGFNSIPSLVTCYLECTTANANYSIGDHVLVSSNSAGSTGNTGISVTFDGSASNDVTVTIATGGVYLTNKTTNVETALTESSWRLRVKAWK